MIGAFKQPSAVFINTALLHTLPSRELSAGLAEIIKYALIADSAFLTWLETHMDALLSQDPTLLATAILKSCQHKADIVAADEFETNGKRALLNLGHTFGHAIETHMGYGNILHGEAVAIGMCMAAHLSHLQGNIGEAQWQRILTIIARANLPTQAPSAMGPAEFMAVMAHDKKNVSGQIRLILLHDIGHAYLTDNYDNALLQLTLSHHLP
jgi:3-dehydroquinate synthase